MFLKQSNLILIVTLRDIDTDKESKALGSKLLAQGDATLGQEHFNHSRLDVYSLSKVLFLRQKRRVPSSVSSLDCVARPCVQEFTFRKIISKY